MAFTARLVDQNHRVRHERPEPAPGAVARYKVTGTRPDGHQRSHYVVAATGDLDGVRAVYCSKCGVPLEGTAFEITAFEITPLAD